MDPSNFSTSPLKASQQPTLLPAYPFYSTGEDQPDPYLFNSRDATYRWEETKVSEASESQATRLREMSYAQ